MEPVKKSWKSKTLIVNLMIAAAAFFPGVADKVTPEAMMQLIAVVNIILRFATKGKVELI